MKKIYSLIMATLVVMSIVGCNGTDAAPAKPKKLQDVQVYSTKNTDGAVTTKSIEAAFDSVGLAVPGNNDMNKPFKTRFGTLHYEVYNLAMYVNNDLTLKLIKKYPNFGALTPLTMSIWSEGDTMNVATLTTSAMARSTGIPADDADLIAYSNLIETALKKAMPNGYFKDLNHTVKFPTQTLATDFVMDISPEDAENPIDFIENLEAEFEAEMEPLGFLLPNYSNLQEEIFNKAGYDVYDFYHTYSICKFDVIYPVSEKHPEAGAWAPCSFYLYKKKGENKVYMGFLSVDNWISTLDMTEEEVGTQRLREAQGFIENIINEMIQ